MKLLGAALVAVLAAQAATVRFEALQPELLSSGGALANAFADYDGDGDPDLFVGFDKTPNRLYRNDGGTFTDVAADAGVADTRSTRAAAWGDMDADGDPDLLVGFTPGGGSTLRLYRNDAGRFADVTAASGLETDGGTVRQPAWVDIDGDGDLDLFVGFRDRANAFFRNDNGRFTNVAGDIGLADARKTVGAVWFDYDGDGDLDLYTGNMDGDPNALFRNTGGRFENVAAAAGVAWGGRAPGEAASGTVRPCAADVNGDGRLDLFMANYGPNGLFLNDGAGGFTDASAAWGVAIDSHYDTCAFADFDNDGDLDYYVNGTVAGTTHYPDYLFRNMGARFEDVTPANIRALRASHGVQWADVDGDGDLDLSLAGSAADGTHAVLLNQLPAGARARSLRVRVLDARGRATLAGSEVRIYAAGTTRLLGVRLVDSGSGYDAQSDLPVHFGLPDLAPVDIRVQTRQNGHSHGETVRGVSPERLAGRVYELRLTR
ncbi:MAG: CRTAC1 family protein, partial [Vicinamibacterales bacterium]